MSMSIEILISIAGMPISVETSELQTPIVSQAGEPQGEGPPALAVAVGVAREADHRQPPSNMDLRPAERVARAVAALVTSVAAELVARAVTAPVTPVVAAHAGAHPVEAHLAVVVRAVVAQRAAAAHVAVVVMPVAVVMPVVVAMVAVATAAAVENKYVIYLVVFERNECFAKKCLSHLCEAAWSCNPKTKYP